MKKPGYKELWKHLDLWTLFNSPYYVPIHTYNSYWYKCHCSYIGENSVHISTPRIPSHLFCREMPHGLPWPLYSYLWLHLVSVGYLDILGILPFGLLWSTYINYTLCSEPRVRIELTTFRLQGGCTTTVLSRRGSSRTWTYDSRIMSSVP